MTPGAQVERGAVPVDQIAQRVVLDHHPLGQAGGAGGVDHVGQSCGAQARYLRVLCGSQRPSAAVEVKHRHA